MSVDHTSSYEPRTGIEKWVDSRLPLPRLMYDSFIAYPVPRNLNFAYTFGAMLSVMLVVQILTGVLSRSAPSLNLFALGLPAGVLAGIAALIMAAPLFYDQLTDVVALSLDQAERVIER